MGMMSDFKAFVMRGNVLDLAVGVIIGAAFGKIVSSVTDDLIMPVVSMFGSTDFSNWYIPLKGQELGLALADAKKLGPVIAYGNFASALINFLILAFIIFMIVKQVARLLPPPPPPPPAGPPPTETYLKEIRDLLSRRPA